MEKEKVLVGKKQSLGSSPLSIFEHGDVMQWKSVRRECNIPEGFMFLVGNIRYGYNPIAVRYRYGKERIFVQNFLPHSQSDTYHTRRYGAIYGLYQPATLADDDVVLENIGLYQAMPNDRVKLILANGENRNATCIQQMFENICQQKGLQDFAPIESTPSFYQVTFRKKSCGYFLKGRTYIVWATPIGIPDHQLGEINKAWLFCDVNCGIPAIMKADRETFEPLSNEEGAKVGLFTVRNGNLVFEG